MDTNTNDPEGSKQSSFQDFDELVGGITRDSVRRRLRHTPDLPRDGTTIVTLQFCSHADGT